MAAVAENNESTKPPTTTPVSFKNKLANTWHSINNFFTKPKNSTKNVTSTSTPKVPKRKNKIKKRSKTTSTDDLNDSEDFTDNEFELNMPDPDNVEKLNHVQKNRAPRPKKTKRITVVLPKASKSEDDLLVDKFYSSDAGNLLDEIKRDLHAAGEKTEISHNKQSITTEESLENKKLLEGIMKPSVQHAESQVQKVALLPPAKTALLPPQNKPIHEATVVLAPQVVRKISVTSEKSLGKSMTSIDEETIICDSEMSSPVVPVALPASTLSLKETMSDAKKNETEFLSNTRFGGVKKVRPISEILTSSALETNKQNLYPSRSDENVLIRRVLLKKAESSYLEPDMLRKRQDASLRIRSTSESVMNDAAKNLPSNNDATKSETSSASSLYKDVMETCNMISLRDKSSKSMSNSEKELDQRKSVFEMRKMFEKAKLQQTNEDFNKNGSPPVPPNRIRMNKVAPTDDKF